MKNYYFINRFGTATKCYDHVDSVNSAEAEDIIYPSVAPHTVAAMLPIDELEALERDAARYRWLRDKADYVNWSAPGRGGSAWSNHEHSSEQHPCATDIDLAIDAAMEQEKQL